MAKMIDDKPSYKGELKLWESLKEYLPNDVVVYNHREINGRQYDFCVMAENIGVLIVEVKGWLANKICVKGVDNIEVEGYDKPETSPKKQARAYRFGLLNKISEKWLTSFQECVIIYTFDKEEVIHFSPQLKWKEVNKYLISSI